MKHGATLALALLIALAPSVVRAQEAWPEALEVQTDIPADLLPAAPALPVRSEVTLQPLAMRSAAKHLATTDTKYVGFLTLMLAQALPESPQASSEARR